jgi:type I restriction enzyme R subunit
MKAAPLKPRRLSNILREYGYPPDGQESATQTVLEQAEKLSEGWAQE